MTNKDFLIEELGKIIYNTISLSYRDILIYFEKAKTFSEACKELASDIINEILYGREVNTVEDVKKELKKLKDNNELEDIITSFVDDRVDIYNSDLYDSVKIFHYSIEDVLKEYGVNNEVNLAQIISMAQARAYEEMLNEVIYLIINNK